MSIRWRIRCPYCHAEFAYGYGYLKIPEVWVPVVRCQYCGLLMYTGSEEYLNMPVAKRLKLKNNKQTMVDIRRSLERTNQEEYRSILTKHGYQFYPITDVEEQRFEGIMQLSKLKPTVETTKSLYNLGILIKKEEKDEKTGEIKQTILDDRQKQYGRLRKVTLWSLLSGFAVYIIFGAIFSCAGLDELSIMLAFLPSIATVAAVASGMNRYYKTKNPTIAEQQQATKKQREAQKKKREQNIETSKKLLEQCGMRFFIKYYRQIKTLPLRDIILSETYSPEEKDERLNAAKKIIDLNLSNSALNTIIDVYGNSLQSEEIEQAKELLAEVVSDQNSEDDKPCAKEHTTRLYDPYDE